MNVFPGLHKAWAEWAVNVALQCAWLGAFRPLPAAGIRELFSKAVYLGGGGQSGVWVIKVWRGRCRLGEASQGGGVHPCALHWSLAVELAVRS